MPTTIELGDEDSALVVRADGSIDACLPKLPEHAEALPSMVEVSALLIVASDESAMRELRARLECVAQEERN